MTEDQNLRAAASIKVDQTKTCSSPNIIGYVYIYVLCNIFAGVQQCFEGQKREFTLVCRDSAGELIGKGGDSVLVSIIHTEKKEW